MDRKAVRSSNISSVGYDDSAQILEVEFVSGAVYQYSRVPRAVYVALMAAPSHGSYFDAKVRKAGYPYTRVD